MGGAAGPFRRLRVLTTTAGFDRNLTLTLVADGIASGELRPVPVIDAVYALIGVLSFSMDLTLAHPEIGRRREGLLRALDLTFTGIASPRPVTQEKRS